jgi:uncharacterized protein (TIGR02453 family)
MITQQTLDFLSQLKQNNTREWFLANKKAYETAKKEVEIFIAKLIPDIMKLDPLIQSPDAKDCMFRIFKDVRFSKDKSPYKTNFGAFIARGGRKTMYPGYYIHIEPGESMIAGGVYQPQPETLHIIRNEVYFNSVEFRKILESKEFKKYFNSLNEFDKMKKAPREFPADFPDAELLKYRSLRPFE